MRYLVKIVAQAQRTVLQKMRLLQRKRGMACDGSQVVRAMTVLRCE